MFYGWAPQPCKEELCTLGDLEPFFSEMDHNYLEHYLFNIFYTFTGSRWSLLLKRALDKRLNRG